jgi:hypothetical protein
MPKGFQKGNQIGKCRKAKSRLALFDERQYCEDHGVDVIAWMLEVIEKGTLNGIKQDSDAPLTMLRELAKYVLIQRKAVDLTTDGEKIDQNAPKVTVEIIG